MSARDSPPRPEKPGVLPDINHYISLPFVFTRITILIRLFNTWGEVWYESLAHHFFPSFVWHCHDSQNHQHSHHHSHHNCCQIRLTWGEVWYKTLANHAPHIITNIRIIINQYLPGPGVKFDMRALLIIIRIIIILMIIDHHHNYDGHLGWSLIWEPCPWPQPQLPLCPSSPLSASEIKIVNFIFYFVLFNVHLHPHHPFQLLKMGWLVDFISNLMLFIFIHIDDFDDWVSV